MQIIQSVAKTYWQTFFQSNLKVQQFQTQLKRGCFFVNLRKSSISEWLLLLLRLTILVLFINISYLCPIDVVLCFNHKQNNLILYCLQLTSRATQTSHMWKNLLIFFFCIFIIDIFSFGGALQKELLHESSRTPL